MGLIKIFDKDKIAGKQFLTHPQFNSNWSIQIDGDLGTDEIAINLVGIDDTDSLTGADGTANQSMTDESGNDVVISASTPNPMGFFRPARVQIVKPVTTNDVGVTLLTSEG